MALSFSRILSPRLPPNPPVAIIPPPNPIVMLSSSPIPTRRAHRRLTAVNSASNDGFYSRNANGVSDPDPIRKADYLINFLQLLRSILPGGTWWNLSDQDVDVVLGAKPVTVWVALRRMWQLVATDRWVIFVAFSSLCLAAIAEISIPHFLTASIFSAQGAETVVFKRNVLLLVLFCVASAICSGLRGGFFSIANMILGFNQPHFPAYNKVLGKIRQQT